MAEIIRYYADQHYPAPFPSGLTSRGIDILTAQDANLCGADDPNQLAFATWWIPISLLSCCREAV